MLGYLRESRENGQPSMARLYSAFHSRPSNPSSGRNLRL